MKIGLLEDNPAIVDWMTTALAMAGHIVYTYPESTSFLECLLPSRGLHNHLPFDLAIVDLHLPGEMSGREVIARIPDFSGQIIAYYCRNGSKSKRACKYTGNLPRSPYITQAF